MAKKRRNKKKLPASKLRQHPARLRYLRGAAGLEQAELAERAGCSQPHLSDLERGWASASVGLLKRLAAALGCQIVDLMQPDPVATVTRIESSGRDAAPSSGEPERQAS